MDANFCRVYKGINQLLVSRNKWQVSEFDDSDSCGHVLWGWPWPEPLKKICWYNRRLCVIGGRDLVLDHKKFMSWWIKCHTVIWQDETLEEEESDHWKPRQKKACFLNEEINFKESSMENWYLGWALKGAYISFFNWFYWVYIFPCSPPCLSPPFQPSLHGSHAHTFLIRKFLQSSERNLWSCEFPTLGRLRQEDHESTNSLWDMMRPHHVDKSKYQSQFFQSLNLIFCSQVAGQCQLPDTLRLDKVTESPALPFRLPFVIIFFIFIIWLGLQYLCSWSLLKTFLSLTRTRSLNLRVNGALVERRQDSSGTSGHHL